MEDRPKFVKTNRHTVWIKENDLPDFYRNLPLSKKMGVKEKYIVECQECDFKKRVTGGKFKAIGFLSQHRINDCPVNKPHNMTVKDVSKKT